MSELSLNNKKVLVVDDEPGTLRLIEVRLTALGLQVIKGQNGYEALMLVKQWLPDLIIMDRMMPKMDGLMACAFIKSDRRFKQIPLILVTASAEAADERLSQEAGADAFVNKPIDFPALIGKVQSLLGTTTGEQG
jgi:CheY-like chemotaxis protein